ncbi:MAG: hypothetical protein II961_08815 [Candidatus Riflebacteria bacterium]|nr:hypothetical protein [Candidatus Riflebacteria bacterium]
MKSYLNLKNKQRPVHNGDYFSFRHPPMDRRKRAKLFMAFEALNGFSEEIAKAGKL